MPRRISEELVEAAILASQHARHDARLTDPAWTIVEDDLTPMLGGGTWRRVEPLAVGER